MDFESDNIGNPINEVDSGFAVKSPGAGDIVRAYRSSAFSIIFRRFVASAIDFALFLLLFILSAASCIISFEFYILIPYVIILFLYYLVIESFTGYTLGKLILRIKVVDNDFNAPGLKKGFIRTIIRLVEVNFLLLGGLPAGIAAALSQAKQRLGDMAASTYVIKVKDIPVYGRRLNVNIFKKIAVISVIVAAVLTSAANTDVIITYNRVLGIYAERNMNSIYSRDESYKMTFPNDWYEAQPSEGLEMHAVRNSDDMYLTAGSSNKSDLAPDTDLDSYMNAAVTKLAGKMADTRFSDTNDILVNGYNARQIEIKGYIDGAETVVLVTSIETERKYNQLLVFIIKETTDQEKINEARTIIQSFKESE